MSPPAPAPAPVPLTVFVLFVFLLLDSDRGEIESAGRIHDGRSGFEKSKLSLERARVNCFAGLFMFPPSPAPLT